MTLLSSERVQRQVARLLGNWRRRWSPGSGRPSADTSRDVLALEPDNVDAQRPSLPPRREPWEKTATTGPRAVTPGRPCPAT